MYLDMLKRVLLNVVYHEQSYQVQQTRCKEEGREGPGVLTGT